MPRLLSPTAPPVGQPFRVNRDSPQAAGLVGWWPTIGATAGALRGYAGPQVPAVLAAGPTLEGDPVAGQLLLPNATAPLVTLPTGAVPTFQETTPFSLTCWFMAGGDAGIMSNWDLGVSPGWVFELTSGSYQLIMSDSFGTAGRMARTTAMTYADGLLHRVVLAYAGTSLAAGILIYVDGVPAAMTTLLDTSPGTQVDIGLTLGGGSAATRIGDFRVHARALSAQEIWQDYAAQTRWDLYRAPRWRTIVAAAAAGRLILPNQLDGIGSRLRGMA